MSVTVKIPTQLRVATGGAEEVLASGGTVAAVLADLWNQFPAIEDRLVDADGKVRRFVNLYVEQEDIRFRDGLATSVPDGGEIIILPAIAGG
jgi:molybdopterin converting factor small subunit